MTPLSDEPRRLDRLIDQWLDDDLGPAETAELDAVLAESPAARRAFWRQASFHSILHEAAAMADPVENVPARTRLGRKVGRAAGLLLASLLLLCIGGVLGSLLTSQAFAGLVKAAALRVGLIADGFESGSAPMASFIPSVPGIWGGDRTAVTGASRGVRPFEGVNMLEFMAAHASDVEKDGQFSSQIWRIVPVADVRAALPKAIGEGCHASVELSAAFNQRGRQSAAGARDVREANVAGVGLYAFQGSMADVRRLWKEKRGLAVASSSLTEVLDEDPGHWQRLRVAVTLPDNADFLLLQCYTGDEDADSPAVFDGQYVDDIAVSVVVDPDFGGGLK